MKSLVFLSLSLLLVTSLAGAPATRAADKNRGLARSIGELGRLNVSADAPSCPDDENAAKPSCNKISDDFCTQLWDEKGGNMKVLDGEVRSGTSDISGIALKQLDDYRALIDSLPRLPRDLAQRARPAILRLKKLLDHEAATTAWKRGLADANRDFKRALKDVAKARRKARFPKLELDDDDDDDDPELTAEQRFAVKHVEDELNDQVMDAKYLHGPLWARVERLFREAQQAVLKQVDTFHVSAELKEQMRKKIRTIRLTLPYTDPLKNNAEESCATTDENAAYSFERHDFTVCIGLVNAWRTDGGLFQTIAHEIMHSVDPNAEALDHYLERSPVAQGLAPLVGAKGAVVPCEKWNAFRLNTLASPVPPEQHQELDGLYECFESRKELEPWDQSLVNRAALRKAREDMSELADKTEFTTLAVPTYTDSGETRQNPGYLRPDRWHLNERKMPSNIERRDANVAEIFTQTLACEQAERNGEAIPYTSPKLTPQERRRLFRDALDKTEALVARQKVETYSYCGPTCAELVESGFSKDPTETWSDWNANRASRYFFERIPTLAGRQQASALANASLCDQAGPKREAPGLSLEEKAHSLEEHPDDRRRRISEYDPVIAQLLGCSLEDHNQGFGLCEP